MTTGSTKENEEYHRKDNEKSYKTVVTNFLNKFFPKRFFTTKNWFLNNKNFDLKLDLK